MEAKEKRREVNRSYYLRHREELLKKQQLYRTAHKDEINARRRERYRKSPEHERQCARDYYKEHREEIKNRQTVKDCIAEHGGCFNCPYPDCILD